MSCCTDDLHCRGPFKPSGEMAVPAAYLGCKCGSGMTVRIAHRRFLFVIPAPRGGQWAYLRAPSFGVLNTSNTASTDAKIGPIKAATVSVWNSARLCQLWPEGS